MLLSVQNLKVECGKKVIISDVSFNVDEKKVTGLYGPSGVGKSTTLLGISGLLDHSFRVSGKVIFRGQDISSLRPEERGSLGISIVLQGLALFPHISVLDNVAYGLERRGVSRREARKKAAHCLAEFRLTEEFEHRLPSNLSGGEQQRVALARAMVCEPSLLLLDEPFKGLEQQLRDELLAIVLRMARNGTAILLVTHEKREIHLAADVVVAMQHGRVVGCEERSVVLDGAPPFELTADRVFLPAQNGCPGGWVACNRIMILPTRCENSGDGRSYMAKVVESRSLTAGRVALLCQYDDGTLAWLEGEQIDKVRVQSGQTITVVNRG